MKEYNIVQEKQKLHYCFKKFINNVQSWEKYILYFFENLLNIENFIFNFADFVIKNLETPNLCRAQYLIYLVKLYARTRLYNFIKLKNGENLSRFTEKIKIC